MNKPTYEEIINHAKMNSDCGEHMSPAEIKELVLACEAQVKQLAAERDAVVAENVAMKSYRPQPQGAAMMEALDAFFEHEDVPEQGKMAAFEILRCKRPQTPATDSILASLRAEAITDALENSSDYLDTDCVMDRHDISYQDAELRSAGAMEMHDSLVAVANLLRSKSEVQS